MLSRAVASKRMPKSKRVVMVDSVEFLLKQKGAFLAIRVISKENRYLLFF